MKHTASASGNTAAANVVMPAASMIDHDELTDMRAYQRTFDGAYTRTALGQLSYAILVLRLFDRDFYWCGLVYTLLAVQLIFVGVYRYNLAMSNDDRWKDLQMSSTRAGHGSAEPGQGASAGAIETHRPPIFRRTFRTAGTIVAWATVGTLVLEIALVVLVIRM